MLSLLDLRVVSGCILQNYTLNSKTVIINTIFLQDVIILFDAVCIGIMVADVIAKPVDVIPGRGKLGLLDKLDLYAGGCAVNAAIDLSKIGLNVAVIGKIGNDGFGKCIIDALKKENVDISGLVISSQSRTSASVVLSDSGGERTFLHYQGSNAEFIDMDINYDIVERSRIVFIAGTMLMPSFDGEPCKRVLKKAKEMGKYTVLDTAWDSTGRWMSVLHPCMQYIDLFIPSYEEAVNLSGKKSPEEIADAFLSMGVKVAVIKLGKEGCFLKSMDGEKHLIPAYKCIQPIDTTGAGDSFIAGFITGLVNNWDLHECGKFANAVGTHCVMAMGASTGIEKLDVIRDFMKKHENCLYG